MVGLDVNAEYSTAVKLLPITDGQAKDACRLSPRMVRTALYLSKSFVNIGLHTSVPREVSLDTIHTHRSHWLEQLSHHSVVPYRLGHAWPQSMRDKIHPERRQMFIQFKKLLDPDSILNPSHPLVTG